ncbi:MAG: redoxin family protein [Saprospiraceae bacterium]|nr:redoxin family protein [Saprospiraceae bacterium]
MIQRLFTSIILLCLIRQVSISQDLQYHIQGHLQNYAEDTIYLGYYFADKQYLIDTTLVTEGKFTFSGPDTLKAGVYLVVMPPDNKFFQIMVSPSERRFSFQANIDSIEQTIVFENATDNTLFYDNLKFIGEKRAEVDEINAQKEMAAEAKKEILDQRLQEINKEVMTYQHQLVDSHPGSLTAALVKSGFQIDLPDFTGTKEEINMQQYLYYKKHYFDHVDLSDDRLIRAPSHVMFDRVNYYLEKLTPQHPDSVIQSLDYLLHEMEGAEDTYKNFLIKFLNDYAQSKIVGMDGVYVHLALTYYDAGKAPWVEETQLKKIIANAKDAEPTLIGKTAPNLTVQLRDSTDITLYDFDSKYLVLVFWAHDCAHCKESMPELKKFYEEYNSKGIEVFSICTKLGDDEPPCWDFVDERELDIWVNASDKKGGRSFMHSLFNVKKTPKVFILDQNKKIISKDLGAEQLGEFFDQIIKPEEAPAKQ